MSLTKCQIKDLGRVVTGHTPPTGRREYYGNFCPLIKPTDMEVDSRYIGNTMEGLSEIGYEKFKNKLVPKNTPCVVTIGTIGKLCLTKETSLCNQAVNSIIVDRKLHDPFFVFYLMRMTNDVVKNLSSGTASGRENVSKSVFESIEIEVPLLPTQQKIASILSAYDDLIENNARRIKILEEMAQSIYNEWFVKFRFPGHENVKMVESELGMIPEGWEVKPFSEMVYINPIEKVSKDDEKPYVPMECLRINSMLVTSKEVRKTISGSKFRNEDTLFARITPCLENGKTAFVQFLSDNNSVGIGSTEFIVFRSKTLCPEYVYLLSRTDNFRENAIKSMAGASGRQRVNIKCFDNYMLPQANNEILLMFSKLMKPLFREIYLLNEKNNVLKSTRDLLLPRLISGEIDVSELDIDVGGITA